MKFETRTIKSLSEKELDLMNLWMEKEFGKKYIRNFKKYYPLKESRCFFIKESGKIAAFGIISPVSAKYLGKEYNLFGMGDLLTIKRSEGYGKLLVQYIIKYLKKSKITALGFCARKNTPFYKKSGLEIKKGFMKRFRYKNPKNGKVSKVENGDGVFYQGDSFIKDLLKTKKLVYLDIKLW